MTRDTFCASIPVSLLQGLVKVSSNDRGLVFIEPLAISSLMIEEEEITLSISSTFVYFVYFLDICLPVKLSQAVWFGSLKLPINRRAAAEVDSQ